MGSRRTCLVTTKTFQSPPPATLVIRIPQSPGPFFHRRHGGYRRARARQNPSHYGEFVHFRFARSHADFSVRGPARQNASATPATMEIFTLHPKTKSVSYLQ